MEGNPTGFCKGCTWIDFDNDDYPDLFVNHLNGFGRLYRNDRAGHFTDVTSAQNIDGPEEGFSCWAWDYDNDGWLDIFATSYDRTVANVVKGLLGRRPASHRTGFFGTCAGMDLRTPRMKRA